ncbi:hypothetical protein GCM10010211_39770 [Streptomyces albospinus]|uniref:LigA protein n=1 Tax=Streptomyces albospinus TaxID=285515 RepID=A0ABQ2V5T5_9ACTN|nr:hypothetical protein [Streptomyces albospinus]GGU70165.1 hypothetical protein GCM10010211_39770 [Streptomyces albospinus]
MSTALRPATPATAPPRPPAAPAPAEIPANPGYPAHPGTPGAPGAPGHPVPTRPDNRISLSDPPQPVRPKPQPDLGPAPRRSRVGLVAQFVLQFLYIPLWALIAICLTVLAIAIDADSNASVGPPAIAFGFVRAGISWRRLRVEWSGRPEDWEPFTEPLLKDRIGKGERNSGWGAAELLPSGVRRATASIELRYFRGLGPGRVDRMAQQYGWAVDWDNYRPASENLPLFRMMPPPEQHGVPAPNSPSPAPGAPWGPLPCRVLMPLLTFVFMPRVRSLELRRSPDAYVAHLRTHLAEKFRTELARDPSKGYKADEWGRILRRVGVNTWHFRGAGAHAVLRVAAEHGWQLDHSYPADPVGELHLCRPNTVSGQGG